MMDDQRAQRAIICCRFLDISTAVIGACPGAAGLKSLAVAFYGLDAIRAISKLFFINSIIRGANRAGEVVQDDWRLLGLGISLRVSWKFGCMRFGLSGACFSVASSSHIQSICYVTKCSSALSLIVFIRSM